MLTAVAISLLLASALAAPTENVSERTIKTPQTEEGSIPVALLLVVSEGSTPHFKDADMDQECALSLPLKEDGGVRLTRSYEDALYADAAAAYKPQASSTSAPGSSSSSGSVVAATFPTSINPSAIPLLLNCAPKVITGHLAEPAPRAYRSVDIDLSDTTISDTPKPTTQTANLAVADISGPGNPPSMIKLDGNDRRRRNVASLQSGVTRYRVSEDYPETHQGNHHLVSKDYPHPNMMRVAA